ncbi:hypothetical protein [Nocardiopsis ansamitocini]|uniref:Uncharacterized protein n=1 Tax=Nocardiopsis ansamitocini TaxID=1670832 RepID=A0A9W6P309_9ACTN|nr:hypothetical protein [Nocardiopsis ansamitocini]GLU46305.1 hypothetical protein Nans01_06560 [Nocardiopsis ansamitocini]
MGIVAVGAIGLTIVLYILGRRGRLLTISALIAGLALTPWIASHIATAMSATGNAVGIAVSLIVAVAASAWIGYEIKEGGGRTATPWIALTLPAIWVAAGGPFASLYGFLAGIVGGLDQIAAGF